MAQSAKKYLSLFLLLFVLFSLFVPGYQGNALPRESTNSLSCQGLLYLECLHSMAEGIRISGESTRHILQAESKTMQRMLSLRAPNPYMEGAARIKCYAPRELGVLCLMVFLTIIIYIFRTDGKKRTVN